MKKLKWILLIITILMMALFLFATCRKTKALENGFDGFYLSISERDQSHYGASVIYDLGKQNLQSGTSDFFILETTSYFYMYIDNSNVLRLVAPQTSYEEAYNLQNTRLIECRLVYDVNSLFLIVYKINFSIQHMPNLEPAISGINKTMLTRFNIGYYATYAFDQWQNDELDILLITGNVAYYNTNCLLNCCYISAFDSISDVDSWVNNQLSNYENMNNLLSESYQLGYDDGYYVGTGDGEDAGYDIGYQDGYVDGEDAGYIDGWNDGNADGITEGFNQGYQVGYQDGENGESAVSKAVGVIGSVFGAVGTVLAIELFPGIPLGLFFLVPLFFAVIGLILWIWRRN